MALGNFLNAQQDFAGAAEHFTHATQIDPGFAGAYNSLGYAYRSLDDLDQEWFELGELPARIENLEAERQGLFALMTAPQWYAKPAGEIAAAKARLSALEVEIHDAYTRWMELESLASRGEG